jgi:hypothetical protein
MREGSRRIAVGVLALGGCGPTIVDLPARDETSGGGSTGTAALTEGSLDDGDASGAVDSGGDTSVQPATTLSLVGCDDDGTVTWLAEVRLSGTPTDCLPVPGLDPAEVLTIGLSQWDGEGGTHELGTDPNAAAAQGGEVLGGTFTLEVATPYHPQRVEYDLVGASSHHAGSVDLQACSFVTDLPCDAGTTGG